MSAWIAGAELRLATSARLELMAGRSRYQYGILAAHWYWIGAILPMLFLWHRHDSFYYISKTHSVLAIYSSASARARGSRRRQFA